MKQTALSAAKHWPVTTSRIQTWSRRAVLKQLAGLRGGQLVIEDDWGLERLGEGSGLCAHVRVHRPDFYVHLLLGGGLAGAETFVKGAWTTDDLTTTLRLFARDLTQSVALDAGWARARSLAERGLHLLRRNTLEGSANNIRAHYDLGNDFFELFLDATMNYSAGIFEAPKATMKDASIAKMDRVCRKLDLKPHDHLLDIGGGWGGLAIYAAENYGCRVTTTTISAAQHGLAQKRVAERGLNGRVRVIRKDYRELSGIYDKLVSIEMIEAVGHEYQDTYFRHCAELLRRDGLMLLQAITTPEYRYEDSRTSVDFVRRYIFPGSCLTSVGQMSASIGRVTDFRTLHIEDIGPHYAETLRRWRQSFCSNLPRIRRLGYGDDFTRMWEYYLSYCEAGFEERIIGDVQMLLARPENRRASVLGELAVAGQHAS